METKKLENSFFVLSETIEREISAPVLFMSYEDAFHEMLRRFAQAIGESIETVRAMYENDESDDDDTCITPNMAYTTKNGQNFDWDIEEVNEVCEKSEPSSDAAQE